MKKLLSIMLTFTVLLSLSGCFAKTEKVILESEGKITENWLEYLAVNEAKYSAVLWGAEYIIEFCKDPDVAGYRQALSAAETVAATLAGIEIPEFTVSQEDISSAMEKGVDISFLELEFNSLETDITDNALLWNGVSRDLLTDGFWSYGTEYLEKHAQFQLDEARLIIRYLRYTTNYLMLLLGKTSYPDNISDSFPALFKSDEPFIDSLSDVESGVSDCLDELEALISNCSEISSIQSANAIILENAVSSGDFSKVYSLALDWGKNAFVIPLPQWDTLPAVYSYHQDRQTENVAWTSVGEDLSDVPNGLVLEYEGLTMTQVNEYIDSLSGVGFKFTLTEENVDGLQEITYTDGITGFKVQRKDDIAILCIDRESICFCPRWYSDYLTAQ